jgi:hypothetical protein
MKKIITLLLVFTFIFIGNAALAHGESETEISETVAGNIAVWFIANQIGGAAECGWAQTTRISKIQRLYDENDAVSAYCFELKY